MPHKIFAMAFASVYPLYVAKAERKGRRKIRYLDKLVDELAKGRPMERIHPHPEYHTMRSRAGPLGAHSAARIVIPAVAPRAVIVWGLSRLIFAAVLMAGNMPPLSVSAPAFSVALVAGVLGLLDVHVRGERILWGNLGVGRGMLYLVYAAAALSGEVVLALVTR